MSATRIEPSPRHLPSADWPEVRFVATARQRLKGVLDHALVDPPEDPSLADLLQAAEATSHDVHGWMIAGGEPTMRADLPNLVRGLVDKGAPNLGLITDGLALTNPKVVAMLGMAGIRRVRVHLHSSEHDAHDWLVGRPGAWRRTIKAIQAIRSAGLDLEISCTVTRPTMPHLAASADLFAALGAKLVEFRRVTHRGHALTHEIAVAARFGLLQPYLDAAVRNATRRGVKVMVRGFPVSIAPTTSAYAVPRDGVQWVVGGTPPWPFLEPRFQLPPDDRGAPSDYVARFGRDEIDAAANTIIKPAVLPPTPLAGGDTPPPGRSGRLPPTQLSYVRLAARMGSMGGDPLFAVAPLAVQDRMRFVFVAPSRIVTPEIGDHPGPTEPETTRSARIRLVKAAQHKAPVLRIASAGSLAHPDAAELLREATRLEFDRIEVAGEGSGFDQMTDIQIRRLRGLSRIDLALFGPDAASHDAVVGVVGAFDATMRALDRLANLIPKVRVGAYAVLRDAADVEDYAEAWDMGDLPGEPFFRLAPRGGSLRALAEAAAQLEPGPVQDAFAAVLPRALFPSTTVVPAPEATEAWGDLPSVWRRPSGADRYGCYTERSAPPEKGEAGQCPGFAEGWSRA